MSANKKSRDHEMIEILQNALQERSIEKSKVPSGEVEDPEGEKLNNRDLGKEPGDSR